MLLVYVGSVFGLFLALTTIVEDVFKAIDNKFSVFSCGSFASLLIGGGVIGALLAGVLADKTKKYITVMKISVALSCMAIVVLFVGVHLKHIVTFDQLQYFVAILCFLAGFFGYITYPLGLDLSIECAFPVTSEATCNGLIIISGHLQGLLFVGIIRGLSDNTLFENLPCKFKLIT